METVEIELVGGQLDGRTMLLSPLKDGLPLEMLSFPIPLPVDPDPDSGMSPDQLAFEQLLYRRMVFAEARHRWLYRLVR